MHRDYRLLCGVLAAFLLAGAGDLALDAWDARAAAEPGALPASVTASPCNLPPEGGWGPPAAADAEDAVEPEPWSIDMEGPEEDAKIEAALVAQGYYREDVPLEFALQDTLHTACDAYGVDYALALGLIETESGFDPEAVNGVCMGLCQLNSRYFPGEHTPAENIRAGMEYLGGLLDRYGDTEAALTAFNAGHDTGCRVYARAVLAAAEKWR